MSIKKPWLPILCLLMISTAIAIGCRRSSWRQWNSYSARFVDAQGCVFDPSGDQHTTSEGQAYAMFFVLVANDHPRFDRLLAWTEVNLAKGDLAMHLPAWYRAKVNNGKWNHDAPPEKVNDQGIPASQAGAVGFTTAVLPYLRAFPGGSSIGAQQIIRMSLMKDDTTGLYGKDLNWYGQNLALFATGIIDRKFEFGPSGGLKVEWVRR